VTVKVIANETSTEVVQSLYPDQSVWTGVSLNSIQIEWDPSYVEDLAKCWKKFRDIRGRSFRRDYWNYLRQFLCRNHEYIWRIRNSRHPDKSRSYREIRER